MFTALHPLLKQSKKLVLKIELDPKDENKMFVIVKPEHPDGEKNPELNQPVLIKNTPEELDREFAETIAKLAPVYSEVCNTITQALAALEEAKKNATKKTVSSSKPGTKPAAAGQGTKPPVPAKQESAPATSQPSALSLFDNIEGGGEEPAEGSPAATDTKSDHEPDAGSETVSGTLAISGGGEAEPATETSSTPPHIFASL